MSKKLLILLASLVIMAFGCNKKPAISNDREADVSDLRVKDFISIDTTGSSNKIVLAKVCTEHPNFKYIYQLQGGSWVVSNNQWCVGTSIVLTASNNE